MRPDIGPTLARQGIPTSYLPDWYWSLLVISFPLQWARVSSRGHRYSATTLLLPIQAQGILGEAV